MNYWIWFGIGIVVGVNVGLFILGLLLASKETPQKGG